MAEMLFLGIDQGSSATKACLIDSNGNEKFSTTHKVHLNKIDEQHKEQDPKELLESVQKVLANAIEFTNAQNAQILSIALACQRSGVCAWSKKDGTIKHNLIHWSDTRTLSHVNALKDKRERIFQLSGLPLTPHYAATKIEILQKQFASSDTLVATLDSYLISQLVEEQEFCTDDTMAARTMLYDLSTGNWNNELAKIFAVDQTRLPKIFSVIAKRGSIQGLPLLASIGDQQAALHATYSQGESCLLNLGTIASLTFFLGKSFWTFLSYPPPDSLRLPLIPLSHPPLRHPSLCLRLPQMQVLTPFPTKHKPKV